MEWNSVSENIKGFSNISQQQIENGYDFFKQYNDFLSGSEGVLKGKLEEIQNGGTMDEDVKVAFQQIKDSINLLYCKAESFSTKNIAEKIVSKKRTEAKLKRYCDEINDVANDILKLKLETGVSDLKNLNRKSWFVRSKEFLSGNADEIEETDEEKKIKKDILRLENEIELKKKILEDKKKALSSMKSLKKKKSSEELDNNSKETKVTIEEEKTSDEKQSSNKKNKKSKNKKNKNKGKADKDDDAKENKEKDTAKNENEDTKKENEATKKEKDNEASNALTVNANLITPQIDPNDKDSRALGVLNNPSELFDLILNTEKSKAPRLFIILPDPKKCPNGSKPGFWLNFKNWEKSVFNVHLLCECTGGIVGCNENETHLLNTSTGYLIRDPYKILSLYGPYLKYSIDCLVESCGGQWPKEVNEFLGDTKPNEFFNAVSLEIQRIIKEERFTYKDEMKNLEALKTFINVTRSELEKFLDTYDPAKRFNGLDRVTIKGNYVRWLCQKHGKKAKK